MTGKTHDKELDTLKADIASLREEIAGLAAVVKKSAGIHIEQEGPTLGDEGHGIWADLLHEYDSSKVQSEKSSGTSRLKQSSTRWSVL